MGRGGIDQERSQGARSLLFGPRRSGSGPEVQNSSVSLNQLLATMYKGRSSPLRALGFEVSELRGETIHYNDDAVDIPDRCRHGLHIELVDQEGEKLVLEYYHEADGQHIFTFASPMRDSWPSAGERRLLGKLADFDPEGDQVMVEFNIKSRADFLDNWETEIKTGPWQLADDEMHYPKQTESALIEEIHGSHNFDGLKSMINDSAGHQSLVECSGGGLLYVRAPLDYWRA